ncbi:MAG: carbamoyl phosphate synthase large subunit, partial [Candidatus Omnitrophica bacterium]|nr:carbamoyl phosphate synthase large subunit [Candidatus Omnitrophota bacterium]
CSIPPISIPPCHIETICEYTRRIAIELKVVGLMNIQYAICKDVVHILEANPRASRTVPLVSKVCNISMARIATQIMLGKKLSEFNLKNRPLPHYGVKEAVFPFYMFPEVDPVLGPEMRSTGEVLGMADSFGMAFYKAEQAAQQKLPTEGTVLITVSDQEKPKMIEVANQLVSLGFKIKATRGTHEFLKQQGIPSEMVNKIFEQRPDLVDTMKNGEVQLVINTPEGKLSTQNDSYIRQAAVKHRIPYITTSAAAVATVRGIAAIRQGDHEVRSLQEYHQDLR